MYRLILNAGNIDIWQGAYTIGLDLLFGLIAAINLINKRVFTGNQ